MKVILPDQKELELPDGATGLDAARAIGPKLAEQAVLIRANGQVQDLRLPLAIVTLGVAWFGVAMLMLHLTDGILRGFDIHGFWTLAGATLAVWLVNTTLDNFGPWRDMRGGRGRWNVAFNKGRFPNSL